MRERTVSIFPPPNIGVEYFLERRMNFYAFILAPRDFKNTSIPCHAFISIAWKQGSKFRSFLVCCKMRCVTKRAAFELVTLWYSKLFTSLKTIFTCLRPLEWSLGKTLILVQNSKKIYLDLQIHIPSLLIFTIDCTGETLALLGNMNLKKN